MLSSLGTHAVSLLTTYEDPFALSLFSKVHEQSEVFQQINEQSDIIDENLLRSMEISENMLNSVKF